MRRILFGLATAAVVATAAHAQAPFADVPRDHWAYDAVNTLAQRGLIIGYPDGTFGGKRAMTRYEFAVVIARMIPQLENYIKEQVAASQPNLPNDLVRKGDLSNYVTREDFDTLRRLVDQFAPELQMLQVDVANLRRDLNDLRGRVATLEEEQGRIKINGELNAIGRGSSLSRGTLHKGVMPQDLDGRNLNTTNNILEAAQVLYNMDLGIQARVTKDISANAVLNIGNYMGGFATNSVGGFALPYGTTGVGSLNAEISPLKAYIEAPVSLRPLGLIDVQAGKTGVQFTPFTLKLADYDSYTNITATDNGDVIFTGGKATFRIGGVGFTAYAGTHGTALLQGGPTFDPIAGGITSPSGAGYPVFFTTNFFVRPFNIGSQVQTSLFPDIPSIAAPATQSAGVRATLGTPFGGTLGLNYVNAGINNADLTAFGTGTFNGVRLVDIGRASVYSADLALNLSRGIGLNAEYANSNLYERGHKFSFGTSNSALDTDKHAAYDARLTFGLGGIALSAGYRQVDPFFGAPGYWGSLGAWKNPTNIKGFVGSAEYAFSKRLSVVGTFDDYRSVVRGVGTTSAAVLAKSSDTKLQHYTAGLRFGLTSTNRVDLGVEQVLYKDLANTALVSPNGDAKENYYNIGLGSDLGSNTSLKLLYQIIDYKNHFVTNGQDARGNVAVAQFQVKF